MRSLLPTLALGMAWLAAGCGDGTAPAQSRAGTLDVLLTDAPTTSIAKAVVTIAQVSLVSDSGEVVLPTDPVTVDLLTLADTVRALAHAPSVPGGSYTKLRLGITGGYIEVSQGRGAPLVFASAPDYAGLPPGAAVAGGLALPSLDESGLTVTLPEAVRVDGDAHSVVLDFDVAQSFRSVAGMSNQWMIRPVIRGADLAAAGEMVLALHAAPGLVLPTVGGRPLTLADFGATLTTAETSQPDSARFVDPDGDGIFSARFAYELPGDYEAKIRGPADVEFGVDPVTTTIHLAPGASDTASVALTSVTVGSPGTALRGAHRDRR